MKKLILILSFLLSAFLSFGQTVVNRAGSANTVSDARLQAGLNFFAPRYLDTTAANVSKGIDSCGAVIYTYSGNTLWVRKCSPKRWEVIGGESTIPTFPQVLNAGAIMDDTYEVTGNSNNFTWNGFGTYIYDNIGDFRVDADSELNLLAGDSLRLIFDGFRTDTSDNFKPLLGNTATGTVQKMNWDDFQKSVLNQTAYESIGSRFTHNWGNAVSPDFTDNTPTATVTVSGGKTNITGGAFNLNNSLSWNAGYIASHSWVLTESIVVKEKSGTSYGIGFRLLAANQGSSYFIHFLLADTTGYIAYTSQNVLPTSASANNRTVTALKWSVNDTLDISMSRTNRSSFIRIRNRANGSTSELFIPEIFLAPSSYSIFTYGGNWDFINNNTVTYTDIYRPKWGTLGTSITYGAYSYGEGTQWISQAFDGANGGWSDFSASSTASLDGTFAITDIAAYIKPQYLIVDYVVNDHNGSVPLDSFSARMTRIIVACQTASPSIIPVLQTGVPQTGGSVVPYNDTVYALATRYNLRVIQAYEVLVASAGTAMDAKFNSGDGIHPNQAGQTQIGNAAQQKLTDLLTTGSPLNLKGVPTSYKQYYNLGLDEDGDLIKWFRRGDTNYAITVSTPTVSNKQPGGINMENISWFGTVVAGLNPQSGGTARLDASGVFGVTGIFTSIMTVGSGANRFDVQTDITVATKDIDMFNDARISGNSQSVYLERFIPQTGNTGLLFQTSTAGGGSILSNYKAAAWMNDTDTIAYMDRGGGWHTDSVSGYNYNVNSLLTDLSWPTKKYVDSVLAGAGGSTTIYNGDGTISGDRTVNANNNELNFINVDGWAVNGTTADFSMSGAIDIQGDDIDISADSVRLINAGTHYDTTLTKIVVRNVFTGALEMTYWPTGAGGGATGTVELDSITAAVGTNTINSGSFQQEWQWNSVAAGYGLLLSSTSTAAASNTQRLFGVTVSGTNATSGQTTTAAYFSNTHAGTTSTNYGIHVVASGGTSTNFALFTGSAVGGDGRVNINNATNSSGHTLLVKSINNTVDNGILVLANNETVSTSYAYNGVRCSSSITIASQTGDVLLTPASGRGVAVGAGITPGTAILQIGAGTTTDAAILFNSGTLNTSPQSGGMEYDGSNFYFSVSSTRYYATRSLTNTATLDFGSTAAQSSADLTITVTGAADGDAVVVGAPNGSTLTNSSFSAWVSSANTVTVRFNNYSSGAQDPASGSFRVSVLKY